MLVCKYMTYITVHCYNFECAFCIHEKNPRKKTESMISIAGPAHKKQNIWCCKCNGTYSRIIKSLLLFFWRLTLNYYFTVWLKGAQDNKSPSCWPGWSLSSRRLPVSLRARCSLARSALVGWGVVPLPLWCTSGHSAGHPNNRKERKGWDFPCGPSS